MYSFKALASVIILLGFSATEIVAQNGERTCVQGGIQCKYVNGSECIRIALNPPFTLSCPDGHFTSGGVYNAGYVGASCIPITTAAGRHSC